MRVALVGYGLAGETFHAPLLKATDGIELAAVVTSDPDRRRRAEAAHPQAVLIPTVAELWTRAVDLGLGLAVVATPNSSHVEVALGALRAGLPVVVDKPLAPSAKEGRRLAAEAERLGLILSVFHNRRWDGDFLTVRRLIEGGDLGDVWRFESRYERWRPRRRPGAWRELPGPSDGGGLLFDLGSHLIDQAVQLFGPPSSVHAEMTRRREGAEVDDDTFISLEHRGGVRSHLWASAVASRPGPRFRVLGSRAGYVVSGMDPQEEALKAGEVPGGPGWGTTPEDRWGTVGAGASSETVATDAGDYRLFYRALVESIRHGAPVPVPAAEAIAVLDVIEAARRSVAGGAPVDGRGPR